MKLVTWIVLIALIGGASDGWSMEWYESMENTSIDSAQTVHVIAASLVDDKSFNPGGQGAFISRVDKQLSLHPDFAARAETLEKDTHHPNTLSLELAGTSADRIMTGELKRGPQEVHINVEGIK
jgi:hypothetical protein